MRKILTNEQIKMLSKNKNVARAGSKSVRYKRDFKLWALRQYNDDGLSAVGIFEDAGFDLAVIGKRAPNRLMNQWNVSIKSHAVVRQTGERIEVIVKRTENRRKMGALKAKVAYLEAENDFLARLRAGKRQ